MGSVVHWISWACGSVVVFWLVMSRKLNGSFGGDWLCWVAFVRFCRLLYVVETPQAELVELVALRNQLL